MTLIIALMLGRSAGVSAWRASNLSPWKHRCEYE
jgi:hypothetical protein